VRELPVCTETHPLTSINSDVIDAHNALQKEDVAEI